jgi:EAL domain-containing protein (putative c-di-GMP-specific phosphodiesterase class I)/GGDEF domain-containing protein
MSGLPLYAFLSRARRLGYRGKILAMALVGILIPLLAIIGFVTIASVISFPTALVIILVALVATLIGTGLTLAVLNGLLEPVILTAAALRTYRKERTIADLPRTFTDEAGTLMADASQTLHELDAALDELAYYDRATGLPNRLRFLQDLEGRIAKGGPFIVSALQFGAYDRIAGAFSQTAADEALRILVERVKNFVGDRAVVARVEGGTLVSAFAYDGDIETLAETLEDAQAALRREIATDEITMMPDLTVGLAIHPLDGATAEILLDHALAAVGTAGPDTPVRYFSIGTRAAARERFLVEQDLRRALSRSEFVLHYQSVIDLDAGRIVGGEALIRWQHPERGLLPPSVFIEIAEESGMLGPIGNWVIGTACRQLAAWKGTALADLFIAVNISARQFHDPALLGVVAAALSDNGVDPFRLEVEMTETAAMGDRRHARRVVEALHELGVSVAIDDFGTGYSAMQSLLDMPFDTIKIDRSFVSGITESTNARAICAAVIALCQGLGATVQAEGTETEAQVYALHLLGCRHFQGFYFARPLSIADFEASVASFEPPAFMAAARLGRSLRANG